MAKKKNKKNKRTKSILLLCFSVAIAVAIILIICAAIGKFLKSGGSFAEQTETNPSAEEIEEEEVQGIAFPYELDGGKLVLNSVFQSDIDNPDAGNEFGENIVSIELMNNSESTVLNADVEIVMANETVVPFHIEYLPAGQTVWAFASDNYQSENVTCMEASVKAEYADASILMEDVFDVSVEDTNVSIANKSDEAKTNVRVYCHCDMGDALFGGCVYTYTVETISANETVNINAEDCFLGGAKVVCIECN